VHDIVVEECPQYVGSLVIRQVRFSGSPLFLLRRPDIIFSPSRGLNSGWISSMGTDFARETLEYRKFLSILTEIHSYLGNPSLYLIS